MFIVRTVTVTYVLLVLWNISGVQGRHRTITASGERKRNLKANEDLFVAHGSDALQITELSPKLGPFTGGTKVLIRGFGFKESNVSSPLKVHFHVVGGPYYILDASVVSSSLLEFSTPNLIDVSVPAISDSTVDKGRLRHLEDSSITKKVKQGTEKGFSNGSDSLSHNSENEITSLKRLVSVSIHRSSNRIDFQKKDSEAFLYYKPPLISSIYPAHSDLSGGQVSYIFGSDLLARADVKVKYKGSKSGKEKFVDGVFDRVLVEDFHNNAEERPAILCKIPAWHEPESVLVTVSFNGQQFHGGRDSDVNSKSEPSLSSLHNAIQFAEGKSLLQEAIKIVKERKQDEVVQLRLKNVSDESISNVLSIANRGSALQSFQKELQADYEAQKRAANGDVSDGSREEVFDSNDDEDEMDESDNLIKVKVIKDVDSPFDRRKAMLLLEYSDIDDKLDSDSVQRRTGETDSGYFWLQKLASWMPSWHLSDRITHGIGNHTIHSIHPSLVGLHSSSMGSGSSNFDNIMTIHLKDEDDNWFSLARPHDPHSLRTDLRLLGDCFSLIVAASIGGTVAAYFKFAPVLGYLISGFFVSPSATSFLPSWLPRPSPVAELIPVYTVAQIGASLIMWRVGMHLSLSNLLTYSKIVLFGGLAPFLLFTFVFAGLSRYLGTSISEALLMGWYLGLSSTAICTQVLPATSKSSGTAAVNSDALSGILAIQDVAIGFMVSILPILSPTRRFVSWSELLIVGPFRMIVVAVGFLSCVLFIGFIAMPVFWLVLAFSRSKELFFLSTIALVFLISLVAERFGLALELGSLTAGLLLTQLPPSLISQVSFLTEPLVQFFSACFFCSIGMLMDPVFLWDNFGITMMLLTFVMILKFIVLTPLMYLGGMNARSSVQTAMLLSHLGEFAFVLLGKAFTLRIVSRKVHLLLLGTTAMSLLITPIILVVTLRILPLHVPQSPTNSVSGKVPKTSWADVMGSNSPSVLKSRSGDISVAGRQLLSAYITVLMWAKRAGMFFPRTRMVLAKLKLWHSYLVSAAHSEMAESFKSPVRNTTQSQIEKDKRQGDYGFSPQKNHSEMILEFQGRSRPASSASRNISPRVMTSMNKNNNNNNHSSLSLFPSNDSQTHVKLPEGNFTAGDFTESPPLEVFGPGNNTSARLHYPKYVPELSRGEEMKHFSNEHEVS